LSNTNAHTTDWTTAKNLELVKSQTLPTDPTLLSVLDSTLTNMGSRLLRMNLLQPLSVSGLIQARLDAVEGMPNARTVSTCSQHKVETELNDNQDTVMTLRSGQGFLYEYI
jgi:DNA mismatch repair ATPase MutS